MDFFLGERREKELLSKPHAVVQSLGGPTMGGHAVRGSGTASCSGRASRTLAISGLRRCAPQPEDCTQRSTSAAPPGACMALRSPFVPASVGAFSGTLSVNVIISRFHIPALKQAVLMSI